MLWLVGLGINGHRGLSLAAVDILKQCDVVYVERYTGALYKEDLEGLISILGPKVTTVERWFVEDGREILETAKSKGVALATYGDPLVATTHSELRARAARNSIKTSVLHAASGITSAIGETGLHAYKFGRMVTMMSEPHSATSVYSVVFDNLLAGSHTLIVTEYRYDEGSDPYFLNPTQVFKMLAEAEADQKHQVFSDRTFAIVASRVGTDSQDVVSGSVRSLLQFEFGQGPHSVIIPGALHFTETEALASLCKNLDAPTDNSQNIRKISSQMVERYAPRAKHAVQQMREIIRAETNRESSTKGMFDVLENADSYISDAERFLHQGKSELAVLSIGYAEGLIDSLRFQKGINPWNAPG
ncbi:MAG: diphthine synthase [Nitrososphaera sp.]